MSTVADLVTDGLARRADTARAARMATYMKTDTPFFGVGAPERQAIVRDAVRRIPPGSNDEYRSHVESLWVRPHREEMYAAIDVARVHGRFVEGRNLDLYERLIREGAWWDLVDPVATKLVGRVVLLDPADGLDVLDAWIDDPELWIRRTAIICQIDHGARADARRLFRYSLRQAGDTDFFIRKAIGWALRQHARTDPEAVRAFLAEHASELAPLSVREASKHL